MRIVAKRSIYKNHQDLLTYYDDDLKTTDVWYSISKDLLIRFTICENKKEVLFTQINDEIFTFDKLNKNKNVENFISSKEFNILLKSYFNNKTKTVKCYMAGISSPIIIDL